MASVKGAKAQSKDSMANQDSAIEAKSKSGMANEDSAIGEHSGDSKPETGIQLPKTWAK